MNEFYIYDMVTNRMGRCIKCESKEEAIQKYKDTLYGLDEKTTGYLALGVSFDDGMGSVDLIVSRDKDRVINKHECTISNDYNSMGLLQFKDLADELFKEILKK